MIQVSQIRNDARSCATESGRQPPDSRYVFGMAVTTPRGVNGYLGSIENLRADQFQLSQNTLYRADKPCNVHFCLQGPRALCLTAIWETVGNSILFHGKDRSSTTSHWLLHAIIAVSNCLSSLRRIGFAGDGGELSGHARASPPTMPAYKYGERPPTPRLTLLLV